MAAGNRNNNNSVPFLFGINSANNRAITKFIIKRIQFFLNELFTDNALGDFKKNEPKESTIINIDVQ
ncbi:hypothetical protein CW731_10005 [Polaribacter sp. ALD11]|nr:hypothetical protein [Polaribacter sp. ALD11]AUC85600.1 hypothetical protein CW731_10005 [Polaribacter sp. ALD11]